MFRRVRLLLLALFGVAVSGSRAAPPALRLDVPSPVEETKTATALMSFWPKGS
jgi:hypothetical protein